MTSTPRRRFLAGLPAIAALSVQGSSAWARPDPPFETDRILIGDAPLLCFAPLYLAEEFLHLEGFRTVGYVSDESGSTYDGDDGELTVFGGPSILPIIDEGGPWVVMSGLHVGCWELMTRDRLRGIRDLKGKKVAAAAIRSVEYLWISSILAYIGMDPRSDVEWAETGSIAGSEALVPGGQGGRFPGLSSTAAGRAPAQGWAHARQHHL